MMQRTFSRHRCQQFAQLYAPDAAGPDTDQGDASPNTLTLQLKGKRYSRYRMLLLGRNPRCFYCGEEVTEISSTLDHLIPLSRGGTSGPGNLELACRKCNGEKNDSTPVEWLEQIQAEVDRLTKRANELAAVIEANDLHQFRADRERQTPTHNQRVPRPNEPDDSAGEEINANFLKKGKPTYSVRSQSTGRELVRGLKFQDAIHVLRELGATELLSLECVTRLSGKVLDSAIGELSKS